MFKCFTFINLMSELIFTANGKMIPQYHDFDATPPLPGIGNQVTIFL